MSGVRPLTAIAGFFLGASLLACGWGSQEVTVVDGIKDLKVGKNNLTKKRRKRGNKGIGDDDLVSNEYIVVITKDAANGLGGLGLSSGGVLNTVSAFGQDFEAIGAGKRRGFRGAPAKKKLGNKLGFNRVIRFTSNKPRAKVIKHFEAQDWVEWIEPVGKRHAAGGGLTIDDPHFKYQWHMKQLGVKKAWGTSTGRGVTVAVIDTGVSSKKDGFFKLLPGKDFVDGGKPNDQGGHGTHVAGTIAQATGNGVGTIGVAPHARILPVRVLGPNGGNTEDVANGIIWAVDNGANIINMSLGGPAPSELTRNAVRYAYENGVTVIAATGNDGYDDSIMYPAAYDSVIAVGAVDYDKKPAPYSNQGKEIALCAPGGNLDKDSNGDGVPDGVVQETMQNGEWGYWFLQGTSMATPHVSGAAALLYSAGVTDPDDIERVLTKTAEPLAGQRGKRGTVCGFGIVDPVKALTVGSAKFAKGGKGTKAKGKGKGKGKGGKVAAKGKGKGKGKGKVASKGKGKVASKGKAKGKGPSGDGPLKIVRGPRVERLGPTRVAIAWSTTQPASTRLKGGGQKSNEPEKTRRHRVVVRGKEGETVNFTIASASGKKNASKNVDVTF